MRKEEEQYIFDIGKNILEVRHSMSLFQSEFAEKMEVTVQTQIAYEKGRRRPPLDYLFRLSQLAKVPVADIVSGEAGKPTDKSAAVKKALSEGIFWGMIKVISTERNGSAVVRLNPDLSRALGAIPLNSYFSRSNSEWEVTKMQVFLTEVTKRRESIIVIDPSGNLLRDTRDFFLNQGYQVREFKLESPPDKNWSFEHLIS